MTDQNIVKFDYETPKGNFSTLMRGDVVSVGFGDETPETYLVTAIPGKKQLTNLATGRYIQMDDAKDGSWKLLHVIKAGSACITVEEK